MKYSTYLKRIANRITPELSFICFAINADWWNRFSPNAWRLKREIKLMVDRSNVIQRDRWPGWADKFGRVNSISTALEERYNTRFSTVAHSVAARLMWLNELIVEAERQGK